MCESAGKKCVDFIEFINYSDVTWASWHLKSPTAWLFFRQRGQADIKLHITAPFEANPWMIDALPSQTANNVERVHVQISLWM